MFEITVDDAKFWKNCVDAIVNLIDEGVLEVTAEGITLKAMDPAQIAMVSFQVPSKAFVEYKVDSSTKVGLNFDNLAKILARSRDKEKLTMALEENKLRLEFKGDTTRSFKVPLLDLNAGPSKEPKIDFDASLKMNSSRFKDVLKDASLVSSHLVLEATKDGFFVDARGDSADLRVESEKTADMIKELSVKNDAKATFPLHFLEDIVKACPSDGEISLNLKTNMPARIQYPIGDASLTYFLAPRIEAG